MRHKSAMAYAHNDVDTAVASFGSLQLIVLIYDRVIDHLRVAMFSVENGGDGAEAFNKAYDLIHRGLLACLDYEQGTEIAENLHGIYEWSLREILSARLEKNLARVEQVINILDDLRGAWNHMSAAEGGHGTLNHAQ